MWSFLAGLVGKLLASLFSSKDPSAVNLAASNATAQTELANEEKANANLVANNSTRASADASVVREQSSGTLDADPAGHWRD